METLLTPKKYTKKQLDSDPQNFFRLINLHTHFKDVDPQSNTDQENLPFEIKREQKWKLKDTHNNVSLFIYLVQNEKNKKGK